MKIILTTVGTSFFTNYMNENVRNAFGDDYPDIKEYYKKLERLPSKYLKEYKYQGRIERLKDLIRKNWFSGIVRLENGEWYKEKNQEKIEPNILASAEIKSLIKIGDKKDLKEEELYVYLLATDTVLSYIAAELIQEWFSKYTKNGHIQIMPEIRIVKGLQVIDAKEFEKEGIKNLYDICECTIGGNFENAIINMTGGYKAILPYLTIFAQVNNIPLYYIFEETEELIYIPQAPLSINWGMFEKYSNVIDDLQKGINDWKNYKYQQEIKDDFSSCIWVDESGQLATLSAIGEAFYNRYLNWKIVYVLSNGTFFNLRKSSIRKYINEAISSLASKLNHFIHNNELYNVSEEVFLKTLAEKGGDNLNHADIRLKNCFIYKHPISAQEVRLLYSLSFSNGKISNLKILDYRAGHFNHDTYIEEFRRFAEENLNGNYVPYLQIKF